MRRDRASMTLLYVYRSWRRSRRWAEHAASIALPRKLKSCEHCSVERIAYDELSTHAVLAVQAVYVSVSLLAEGNLKGTQLDFLARKFRACAERKITSLRGRVAQTYV